MSNTRRKLKIGTFLSGFSGITGWRAEGKPSDAAVNYEVFKKIAEVAEEGLYDFLFNADSAYITKDSIPYFLSRFEPLTILSALAVTTKHVGLVGTFSTSYSEPFTTARQLASLDKLSGGRAGWNAVTSALEGLGRNHGQEKIMEHNLRYKVAGEYLEVAKGLWDSWEDDAFLRNKETGQYVNFEKMHTLDHQGDFFKVQGPLNMERSPQGRPIVFQAGGSDEGRDLAAKHADAIYSRFSDLKRATEFSEDLAKRAEKYGRSRSDILIFPQITPIVAATKEEAEEKYLKSIQYIDIELALQYMSRFFSFHDFTQYPLDEPLPDLGDIAKDSFKSTADYFISLSREENLTLRQLALRVATPKGDYVGTPEQVADKIQALYETGVIDGLVLSTHSQPEGLIDFNRYVIPILQERGIYRKAYESTTLRGNLELEYPVNRYVKEVKVSEQATT